MAKLKDIADLTGFSVATVSRILNHDDSFNVSDVTREKVLKAANKLNYLTLSQRQRKNIILGLAYWYSSADEVIDSHYLLIRSAIEEHCKANDVELKLFYLHEKTFDDITKIELDGLMALGKFSDNEISSLKKISPNFVLVDCKTTQPDVDIVTVDLTLATNQILKHLSNSNITSYGFIGGIESTLDGQTVEDERFKIISSSENIDEDAIHLGRLTPESGYEMMSNIIKSKKLKKAYIVATDIVALGCLKALAQHKIAVPDDVSIISYNNILISKYLTPGLTTVDLNAEQLGIAASEMVLERIKNKRTVAKKTYIPTQLIIRETCV